ncbi:MAG: hypothetical protein ACPMAG_11335, partial [Limisphaerales bacterium]
ITLPIPVILKIYPFNNNFNGDIFKTWICNCKKRNYRRKTRCRGLKSGFVSTPGYKPGAG